MPGCVARSTLAASAAAAVRAQLARKEKKRERTPTFNHMTDPYHLPFCLDIYISKGSVRACVVHRATSKVVAVAHSISKEMKFDLALRRDAAACADDRRTALAQRALSDDIHNVVYTPRKGEKIEGKLQVVLQAIVEGRIDAGTKRAGSDAGTNGRRSIHLLPRKGRRRDPMPGRRGAGEEGDLPRGMAGGEGNRRSAARGGRRRGNHRSAVRCGRRRGYRREEERRTKKPGKSNYGKTASGSHPRMPKSGYFKESIFWDIVFMRTK